MKTIKHNKIIRNMIYHYPDLFPNKAHALHHIFCVIGNGYEWHKGEIVYWTNYDPQDPYVSAKEFFEKEYAPGIFGSAKRYEETIALIKKTHENIDNLCHDMTFTKIEHIYPPCPDYAKLWQVSSQITDEWQSLWQEAYDLFMPIYREHKYWKPEMEEINLFDEEV